MFPTNTFLSPRINCYLVIDMEASKHLKQPMILHDRLSFSRANEMKSVTSSPLRAPAIDKA